MTKSAAPAIDANLNLDRRSAALRDSDRRGQSPSNAPQSRRKQQRRRQIDPTTCERDYNEQEIEFMHAMDEYKRAAGRMFPTCSEVLEVVRSLGYVQLNEEQRDSLGLLDSEIVEVYSGQSDDDFEDEL